MPDRFVPLDTTELSRYYTEVAGRNILYRYTIEYADAHRRALNGIRTSPQLKALLDADTRLVDDFTAYAARNGVAPDPRGIAHSRRLIEAQLRAYIGRNTDLEDSGYYLFIHPVDNAVVQALELLDGEEEPVVR